MHGFIFGKLGNKYISKKEDKDGHILIVGGAGSGKTSCIAIPSLLAWREKERVKPQKKSGKLSPKIGLHFGILHYSRHLDL